MYSFINSMIMGPPTLNRSPSVSAPLLSAVILGVGLALSYPQDPSVRLPGLILTGAAGLWLWLQNRKLRGDAARMSDAQSLWDALMLGGQDAITVLTSHNDRTDRTPSYEITHANIQAHALFGQTSGALIGRSLLDLLPETLYAHLHQQLREAAQTRQPQVTEHALPHSDAHTALWLHHQIIPLPHGFALISRDTTQARRSIEAVREKEAFYCTLIDCLPMAVFARSTRPSTAGEYVLWNKAAEQVMQLPAQIILGQKANQSLPPEVTKQGDEQDLCVLREPGIHRFPNLIYRTLGGDRVVDLIKVPVYGVDGEVDHILSIANDVTDQKTAAEQLKLASRVIEETGDAVVVSDAVDRIVMVNPAFLNLTGMSPSEVVGRSAELLGMSPLRESHLVGVNHALGMGRRWSGESTQVCQDGRSLDIWLSVSTLRNGLEKITQHIRVFSDISVLKTQQRELIEQASHDSLTGLPNRRAFGERLAQAMARSRRNQQELAVLFVDLDGFKAVNDRYGHAAGDAVLTEVAKRLLHCVRLTDCVCRLGGDEFTVILEGVGPEPELVRICQRILDSVSKPHVFEQEQVIVSPSIGAAMYDTGETPEALCHRADESMYAAKHAGKAGFVLSPSVGRPRRIDTAPPVQMLKQGPIG
ncbi:MAG: diguanylate cyclase [Aquabacterium sp.]|nr:diguanylate cyclase [Aquabacterium sp.]